MEGSASMRTIEPMKVNYRITDKDVDNLVCIEVLEEKYEGTVFHFGKVGRIDNVIGAEPGLKFEFYIDEGNESLEKDDEFKDVAASILYDLVLGQNK